MTLQRAAEIFSKVEWGVPQSVTFKSPDEWVAHYDNGWKLSFSSPEMTELDKRFPLDTEVMRLGHVVDEQNKALLHWRRAYDEIDAKETEAWRQVNELTQKLAAAERQIERMKAHIERQDKNFVAAKVKRQVIINGLLDEIWHRMLDDLDAQDSLADDRIQTLLFEYEKLWLAYQALMDCPFEFWVVGSGIKPPIG